VQLDAGTIALSGPVGRGITQSVARAVFTDTDAGGLRYTSRVDVTEECWAIFDTVAVWVSQPQSLSSDDADLDAACTVLGLILPEGDAQGPADRAASLSCSPDLPSPAVP